jgi:hypothetical protein
MLYQDKSGNPGNSGSVSVGNKFVKVERNLWEKVRLLTHGTEKGRSDERPSVRQPRQPPKETEAKALPKIKTHF